VVDRVEHRAEGRPQAQTVCCYNGAFKFTNSAVKNSGILEFLHADKTNYELKDLVVAILEDKGAEHLSKELETKMTIE
jgi:hypothetical protein